MAYYAIPGIAEVGCIAYVEADNHEEAFEKASSRYERDIIYLDTDGEICELDFDSAAYDADKGEDFQIKKLPPFDKQ